MDRLYRPRSFLSLLLTGFVFVSLPLVTALFSSIQNLEGLLQQSAAAVYRSVSRIEGGRTVADLFRSQERAARLFVLLGEEVHRKDVNALSAEVATVLHSLAPQGGQEELVRLADELRARENHLVAVLNRPLGGPETREKEQARALGLYTEISALVTRLERLGNELMSQEVAALEAAVQTSKRALVWQVSGLIGFSVLLVVVFIGLILKPVRQLDRAIERLGEGDFATPIVVGGTRDLESIGGRLDWLRKRLRTLDREKVRMLAHISHELKTPLASIKEGAGLLKDGLVGPLSRSQTEVVSILDSNCRKLQKLIQNILDFNMAQAREAPPDLRKIRLDELIEEVAGDHRNVLLARTIQLDLQLEPVTVSGDRTQLKTALDNLLANAVKFVPDGGVIGVFMKDKGNRVNVLIEDNGPGISEEDRAQIFQPFFQGKQQGQSPIKGSGLGLAISREYVENGGGTLRLLPSSHGARFSMTLPRAAEEAP